ncbi:MAG: DUF2946 family protein [Thermodesulfobacteriota bacterium]
MNRNKPFKDKYECSVIIKFMTAKDNKPRIFIDKRGDWYQDGLKITHRWTYLENNKNLDIDEEGNFFVDEGFGRIFVEVEDTPFVIKMIDKKNEKFYLILNDETVEDLKLGNIWINNENVPYTKVKNNKFVARFLSPAYYELMKYAEQDGDDFYFNSSDKKIKINIKQP